MASLDDAGDTLGALQIGGSIAVFLFGVETLQTYYYFKRYPNDYLWLKLLVFWIWLEELGHTISVSNGMYQLTVTSFGDTRSLHVETIPDSYAWCIIFSGSIGTIVEVSFAYRVYLLSRQLYLSIIALVLISIRFSGSLILASNVFGGLSMEEFSIKWGWLNTICFSTGAGADIIVTAGQYYYLYRERSIASGKTLELLDRLLAFTIETGLLPSIIAFIILILWGKNPHSYWWFGVFLFYVEVFANSFMAILNTRRAPGDARYFQSVDRSTLTSHNSQRFKQCPKPKFEHDVDIELGSKAFLDSFCTPVPPPHNEKEFPYIDIAIPQKVCIIPHSSLGLDPSITHISCSE